MSESVATFAAWGCLFVGFLGLSILFGLGFAIGQSLVR